MTVFSEIDIHHDGHDPMCMCMLDFQNPKLKTQNSKLKKSGLSRFLKSVSTIIMMAVRDVDMA